MRNSEKIAIAAHLHVLLRRKTGRVTDTEWMATDAAYAREIVRFARENASKEGHHELAEWASKLEAAVLEGHPVPAGNGNAGTKSSPPTSEAPTARYVWGIR